MTNLAYRIGALLGSRTIWGGIILVVNAVFGKQLPEELGSEMADAMIAVFTSIGAALVVIGRLGAKEIVPQAIK